MGGLTLVLDLGLEALLVVGRVGDHLDPPVGERHAVFPLQTIKKYFHAQVLNDIEAQLLKYSIMSIKYFDI